MNLVRKYKCYKLTRKVDDKTKEIFDYVNEKLKNLEKFENKECSGLIFFMNSNEKCILEYNSKNEYLFVRYNDFWQVLETKFNLKYSDIQSFIQYKVETAYKIRVKTTNRAISNSAVVVEKAYKRVKN